VAAGDAATSFGPWRLFRRRDADRDQRGIGRGSCRPARGAFFTQKLRLIAGRTAISGHQNLVVLALHRTTRDAIRFDHSNARARRTGLALRTGRTGRPGRTCWPHRTSISFGTLRTRRTLVALRTFATAGQRTGHGQKQRHRNCQMRCTHFQILPSSLWKAAPVPWQ
jgi:hypothetical protein